MSVPRASRAFAFLLTWLLVASLAPSTASAADAPLPASMAAVGDSITRAASSAGSLGVDAPQNSWSTGTNATVNSHYLRLLAAGAPISGASDNRAVSGAKMAGMTAQMQTVSTLHPDYLTVLIGGNDLCTDTVGQMTSVTDFRAQFETSMAALAAGSPGTRVYVSSIPNVYQLWNLFKGNFWARFIWATAGICQSLLANPTSTQAADVQRRDQVRQRNIDYNTQLAQVCAAYVGTCLWDGNAAFNTAFATGDVSGDYFHPSVAGQAKLAAVSWAAGYHWVAAPPPNQPPVASFTSSCSALACTFTDTSTDDSGSIASRTWTFGDGALGSGATASHTYATSGTYTVGLTVTDGPGLSAGTTTPITVTSPPVTDMWLSGLSGSGTATRSNWTATVTVTVSSAAGLVAGATATGTWSGTAASCVTQASGSCSISRTVNKKTSSIAFTLSGLTRAGYAYAPTENTVPSTVTVVKP